VSANSNIIGITSGATYMLGAYNTMINPASKENYDNNYIQTSANTFVVTTETSPLGKLGSI
jgi:uncharacterized protein (UPF0371 family)